MSKAWGGGIGAWAADAELAEAEEAAAAAAMGATATESFPSLKEAVATKPKKKKMSLAEFNAGGGGGMGSARFDSSTRLTPEEMQRLPTGPKERSAEEYGRMGGGFRSYGPRRDDYDGQWSGGGRRSYGGGFDDDRGGAPPARSSDFDLQPSRADEADNWAAGKKPMGFSGSSRYDRGDHYSSIGGGGIGGSGGGGGGSSRADEVDNWASSKKPLPARSGFGLGLMDSGGGARERPRLVLDKRREDSGAPAEPVKSTRASPFGAARPREEVLAQKGFDWRKMDSEMETKKASRPPSAQSSRPSSAHSNRPESPGAVGQEAAPKPRPKINPFGDAKPREVVLQEHGVDWRKKDLELERRSVDRFMHLFGLSRLFLLLWNC